MNDTIPISTRSWDLQRVTPSAQQTPFFTEPLFTTSDLLEMWIAQNKGLLLVGGVMLLLAVVASR